MKHFQFNVCSPALRHSATAIERLAACSRLASSDRTHRPSLRVASDARAPLGATKQNPANCPTVGGVILCLCWH